MSDVRKFQAIGYILDPAVRGRAIADNERRILGDCRTYTEAATLALLWSSSAPNRRSLVIMANEPTATLPSLPYYSHHNSSQEEQRPC